MFGFLVTTCQLRSYGAVCVWYMKSHVLPERSFMKVHVSKRSCLVLLSERMSLSPKRSV